MKTSVTGLPSWHRLASAASRRTLGLAIVGLTISARLLATGPALAVDAAIPGKKVLLKNTPKFLVLGKDPAIDVAVDPRCPAPDSSLSLDDGVNKATFVLPCTNWVANGSSKYQFNNASAPAGPSEVKLIKIKEGFFKILGKDLGGLPIANGNATIDVVFNLAGISRRYCMTLDGTGDGSKFLAKNAAAGSCPSPAPCGASTGGFCWFLGGSGASCDVVCALQGRVYDSATETYAGSGGSDANCTAVLDDLGVAPAPLFTSAGCFDGLGCFNAPPEGRGRCSAPTTNSTASSTVQRACACQ